MKKDGRYAPLEESEKERGEQGFFFLDVANYFE